MNGFDNFNPDFHFFDEFFGDYNIFDIIFQVSSAVMGFSRAVYLMLWTTVDIAGMEFSIFAIISGVGLFAFLLLRMAKKMVPFL